MSRVQFLVNTIFSNMRIAVDDRIVDDSFPRYERPSALEMETAVLLLCDNKPIPKTIEAKLETKPTKEMLDDFCSEHKLLYEHDYINGRYVFTLNPSLWQKETP